MSVCLSVLGCRGCSLVIVFCLLLFVLYVLDCCSVNYVCVSPGYKCLVCALCVGLL